MPKTINEALNAGSEGFHIGQRIILPFRAQLIKLIIGGDIFTEMVGGAHIKLQQDPKNTSVYFRTSGKLDNMVDTHKVVKMIVCEWDQDLTDMHNHIKLICEMDENHVVKIHRPSDDMLFIE